MQTDSTIKLQFNDLPEVVSQINEKLNLLLERSNEAKTNHPTDRWLDLNELVDYDPEKRSKDTFYGYVHNKEIPFHKRRKKLIFLKSEIDNWLKLGRKRTLSEIESEANTFVTFKKGKADGKK